MESERRDRVRLSSGITVPYISRGDDDALPVVFLHGWGESAGVFDRVLPLLPRQLRAFAFDQRGHGGATKPQSGYELADAASDVRAFLDALDLPSAVLVGSSSGGYIAQEVAASYPDRVSALVLVGAPRSLQGRAPFADEVESLTDPVDAAWVRRSLTWFRLPSAIPAWYIDDRVQDGVRMPAHALRLSLAGLTAASPPTDHGTITCAALIIRGADDELIALADHELLAERIPDSRLLTYPNTGHLVLWEHPARVAADTVAFISGIRLF
ncbi:MAG: alpha/beta hydrolase [Microbacterium sp.]